MSEPDVLLNDDETTIVGLLELVAAEDEDAAVSIDPADGSITIEGETDGETVEISPALVEAATVRAESITIEAPDDGDPAEIGADLIKAASLRAESVGLGGGREYANEGTVRVNRGGDQDLDPRPGIELHGGITTRSTSEPAKLIVFEDGNQAVSVRPDLLQLDGGEIRGPDRIESGSELQVGSADVPVGGGPDAPSKDGDSGRGGQPEFRSGEITVKGDTGDDDEAHTTATIRGASPTRNGSSISLRDESQLRTVDLDAGEGRLTLGGHTGGIARRITGQTGNVRLADGRGSYFNVEAADGTLTVELEGAGPVFEIDAVDEEIRTKYSIEEESL